jgi:hypothetical protein
MIRNEVKVTLKYKTKHVSSKSSDLLTERLDEAFADVQARGGVPDLSSLTITYTPHRIEGEQGYIDAYFVYRLED